jgi:hypothetical protein
MRGLSRARRRSLMTARARSASRNERQHPDSIPMAPAPVRGLAQFRQRSLAGVQKAGVVSGGALYRPAGAIARKTLISPALAPKGSSLNLDVRRSSQGPPRRQAARPLASAAQFRHRSTILAAGTSRALRKGARIINEWFICRILQKASGIAPRGRMARGPRNGVLMRAKGRRVFTRTMAKAPAPLSGLR